MSGDKLPVAGIVLCGGHSLRMGQPKLWLPIGKETLLQRVVRTLASVVAPVVVVAAANQTMPPLPSSVRIVIDRLPDEGPLEGLLTGLEAIATETEAAFVASCDAPLLTPAFITAMIAELGTQQVAVPCDLAEPPREYPLAAVYRTSLLPTLAAMRAQGERRLRALLTAVDVQRVPVDRLRPVDPDLHSLLNCNTPADYDRARLLTDLLD